MLRYTEDSRKTRNRLAKRKSREVLFLTSYSSINTCQGQRRSSAQSSSSHKHISNYDVLSSSTSNTGESHERPLSPETSYSEQLQFSSSAKSENLLSYPGECVLDYTHGVESSLNYVQSGHENPSTEDIGVDQLSMLQINAGTADVGAETCSWDLWAPPVRP